MSILNDKYDHQEKLIPTLKNKLDKLPKALTDEMMLENHRTSLNVYEQLKELGAKSCFDGTVIYNLTQKFTMQAKKDFERFKVMQKRLENVTINDQTFDEDGYGANSVESKKKPLDLEVVDNSPEHRKYFLHFIREEARLLEYTKENDKETNQGSGKISKMNLYYTTSAECPCCNSEEPHLNNFGSPTTSIGRCQVFEDMPLEERKEYAKVFKACYVCLKPGHSAKYCSIKTNCTRCKNERHHPLLCPKYKQESGKEEIDAGFKNQ